MIVQASILTLGSTAVAVFLTLTNNPQPNNTSSNWPIILISTVLLATFVFCIVVGAKTLARRLWALWVGLVITLIMLIGITVLVVGGMIAASRNCLGFLIILAIIGLGGVFAPIVLLTVVFMYVCALMAYYANRNVMRWLRGGIEPESER